MPHLWSLGLYCSFTNSDFLEFQETSTLSCTHFLDPQIDFLDLQDLLGFLTHFLGILVHFLDFFWWKYWYLTLDWFNGLGVKYQYHHQKRSRKWTNMHRKRVMIARMSRKPVWGSRKCITRYKEGLHWPRKCMNYSVLINQYFDPKWSRKPSNMPRKCLRRPRKRVIESRSDQWDISYWNSSS